MSTNFTGSTHTNDFAAFSRTMRNWWGNTCISDILKYTIGWELDGKKTPILWEKYHYRFPRFSPYHRFCCIFLYSGKFMGKPMHFPYAEVYQGMGIGWEKKHPYYGKSLNINFPDVPHTVGFVAFSRKCKCKGNPYTSHLRKYTIGWESDGKRSSCTIGKLWLSFSQTLPIPWVLLHFPALWEFYGETHTFPICWSIP